MNAILEHQAFEKYPYWIFLFVNQTRNPVNYKMWIWNNFLKDSIRPPTLVCQQNKSC